MAEVPPNKRKVPMPQYSPSDVHQAKEKPAQQARQGVELGHMRYVLVISLGLAVLVGIGFAIYILS